MQQWNRRRVLASLGILGGSALLSGCGGRGSEAGQELSAKEIAGAGEDPRKTNPARRVPARSSDVSGRLAADGSWRYQLLDPVAVGETAYAMYPQGSCMYAVFGSVMTHLADEVGDPFRSFPLGMMRFGAGGVGGWGSVCGVVNGCAALIGLFHDAEEDPQRNELIADLCLWYESTALPRFEPAESGGVKQVGTCAAESVVCHISVSQWCKANDCDAYSPARRERCRRMSADGARKVVELLNGELNGSKPDFLDFTPHTQSCIDCHGKQNIGDSLGKMSCISCHQVDDTHP